MQQIKRKDACKLCGGKGIMTLQFNQRWYNWCVQCEGTGWVVYWLPVRYG